MEPQAAIPHESGRIPHVSAERASPPAISIRGLTKRYGPLTALNDLNLDIDRGEIFGFLGLNGAGKTTTIRLLLDLLRPTSGEAFIFGYNCWTEGLDARARIGYLPGELGLYLDLTGLETLDFLAGLNRQPVDKQHRIFTTPEVYSVISHRDPSKIICTCSSVGQEVPPPSRYHSL